MHDGLGGWAGQVSVECCGDCGPISVGKGLENKAHAPSTFEMRARLALGALEVTTELTLVDAIDATCLLLRPKLQGKVRFLPSELGLPSVHASRIRTSLERAFRREAPLTLEKQLLSLATTQFAN